MGIEVEGQCQKAFCLVGTMMSHSMHAIDIMHAIGRAQVAVSFWLMLCVWAMAEQGVQGSAANNQWCADAPLPLFGPNNLLLLCLQVEVTQTSTGMMTTFPINAWISKSGDITTATAAGVGRGGAWGNGEIWAQPMGLTPVHTTKFFVTQQSTGYSAPLVCTLLPSLADVAPPSPLRPTGRLKPRSLSPFLPLPRNPIQHRPRGGRVRRLHIQLLLLSRQPLPPAVAACEQEMQLLAPS